MSPNPFPFEEGLPLPDNCHQEVSGTYISYSSHVRMPTESSTCGAIEISFWLSVVVPIAQVPYWP
jgi:hypothetical protein